MFALEFLKPNRESSGFHTAGFLPRDNERDEHKRHLQVLAVYGKVDVRAISSGGGMADTYV